VWKKHICPALGMAANRSFTRQIYPVFPDILAELAISRGDGTLPKSEKYKQIKLLILNEYLLFPLKIRSPQSSRDEEGRGI